jgi:ClpP class serine protease
MICDKLRLFCQDRKIPLYTFAEDLAASGGYFFLCIGDKVYAQKSSLVGSIGVIYMRMAFHKFLANRGIQPQIISSNPFDHQLIVALP